jgi:hypothetical protein
MCLQAARLIQDEPEIELGFSKMILKDSTRMLEIDHQD